MRPGRPDITKGVKAMGLAEEWLEVRERKADVMTRYKDLQAKLLVELGSEPRELAFGGSLFKLTPVTARNVKWDEAGVIAALSVPQRKRLVVVKLDTEALNAALKSKELNYKKFGPLKTIVEGDSYVRVTAKA